MDWQPIETAPKDGTEILVHEVDGAFVAYWQDGWRWLAYDFADGSHWLRPTHWMPLPQPPEVEP